MNDERDDRTARRPGRDGVPDVGTQGTATMTVFDAGQTSGGRGGQAGARQAVIVLAGPPARALDELATTLGAEAVAALQRARLLDLVGALLQVDGTTTTLIAEDQPAAERLRLLAPAGIDVVAAPADVGVGPLGVVGWAIGEGFDRARERVVAVREIALPLPPRIVATALSALAGADLVAGPTPTGDSYLIGARDPQGAVSLASLAEPTMAAIEQAATEDGLVLRRLEPRRTLEPGRGLDSLAADIERLGDLAPHLRRWLDERRRGRGRGEGA